MILYAVFLSACSLLLHYRVSVFAQMLNLPNNTMKFRPS